MFFSLLLVQHTADIIRIFSRNTFSDWMKWVFTKAIGYFSCLAKQYKNSKKTFLETNHTDFRSKWCEWNRFFFGMGVMEHHCSVARLRKHILQFNHKCQKYWMKMSSCWKDFKTNHSNRLVPENHKLINEQTHRKCFLFEQ